MKIIKGVVKVVGLIATVLSFIPGPHQPIAAAVAAIASVVSVALEVAAPTKARSNARGSPTEYRLDPNTGIPYLMGRTQYAGTCIKRETYGKDNKYQTFTSVYSLGPIDAVEQFTADRAVINFDGAGNAIGQLHDRMWFKSQVGLCPSPFMDIPNVGYSYPGWTSSRKLSGLAASHWTLKFDKDGEFYTGGPPTPGVVARGVKVYDPRLDSTYPGGSGTCRALQEDTYVYSTTPHLHALTYALGRWQNGKRRFGIGFPKEAIDIAYFVNAANVDEANNWKVSGLIFSNDSKWNCLKMIMECGGGEPITLGGRLSGTQSAPRVSIATITSKDICGRCSVTGTQGQRERINGVVPRYRSEAHGWEMIPAETVRIASYVTSDGRLRTRELEWGLVNDVKQASQLSSYFIMNSREFGPIDLTLKIRWVGLKPGDCVTLNIPELNLNNQKALVLNRSFDVSSGAVTLTLRSETDGKHASSLALDGSAPPIPSLTYDPDAKPAAPAAGSWTLTVGALASSSGTVPSLRFTGAVDNDTAEGVEFAYRRVGTTEWFITALAPPSTIRADESAVQPGAQYEGRVRYHAGGKFSAALVIGPTTVEAAAASTAVVASSITGQGPGATAPAADVLNEYVQNGQNIVANSEFANGLYGWRYHWEGNTGRPYTHGLNLPGWSGQLNVAYATVAGLPAAGSVFDGYQPVADTEGSTLRNYQRWALPVVPGERIFASALIASHRCTAYVAVQFRDGDGNYVTESGTPSSPNGPPNGANGDPQNFTRCQSIFAVPANARYVYIHIRASCDGTQADPYVFYTQMMLAKIPSDQIASPPYTPGPADRFADVTSYIDGPSQSVNFNYDYTGTAVDGQVPRDLTFKLLKSSLQVTSGVSWSWKLISGTVNGRTSANGSAAMTGAGTGTLTVNSISTATAKIEVSATHGGVTRTTIFDITRTDGSAPPPAGGGTTVNATLSAGSSAASVAYHSQANSDYNMPNVRTGSSGQIAFSGNLEFNYISATDFSGSAFGKFQYRVAGSGGSWNDADTEDTSTVSFNRYTNAEGEVIIDPGYLPLAATKTGLTANTDYEIRCCVRDGSSAKACGFSGPVSATGS